MGHNFEANLELAVKWLANLNANINTEDPWAEIGTIKSETFNIGSDNQEFFNEEDKNFIDKKLDIILEALKEFAIDFTRIADDLDYLKKSGKKVLKKDWGLMVMGNVMGWAMGNAIPSDSIHKVMDIIVQNLQTQTLLG